MFIICYVTSSKLQELTKPDFQQHLFAMHFVNACETSIFYLHNTPEGPEGRVRNLQT